MPNHLSRKVFLKRMKALGFEGPFSGTKHAFLVRGELRVRIPNPHGKDLSAALVSEILRQAGISRKEWESVRL